MSIWQSSVSNALGPGVYGVNVKPPQTIVGQGQDVTCIVEQFPWGPFGLVYQPTGIADRILTFYPPGASRNGAGALALSGKGWPSERVVRVMAASGTATASATFQTSGAVSVFSCQLKFPGILGNSMVGTISAATDGVASHAKLVVTLTGATGTTTDTLDNLNFASAAALTASLGSQLLTCRLIGGLTWIASGTVATGSTTFTGGLEPSPVATDYIGTQGLGDKGLALTESNDDINHIFYGNPATGILAACNAGLYAHAVFRGDRGAYIAGAAAQTSSAALTDVANYRADNCVYVDAWMQQISDQDSTIQTIPAAPMAASVAAQVPVSTGISWRDSSIQTLMTAVVGLEQSRGSQALTESNNGICVLIKKKNGGFAFYTDVTTNAPNNGAAPRWRTQRTGIYILESAINGFQSNVEGPNVPATQLPMRAALTTFLQGMVFNRDHDPAHNPYIQSFSLSNDQVANPQSSLDAGNYVIPTNVKTDAGMIRIFVPLQYGPTVQP